MKSSIFLTGAGAVLAAAVPLEKRAYKTSWVVEMLTVTVTAGNEPAAATEVVYLKDPESPKRKSRPAPSPVAPSPEPVVIVTTIIEESKPQETTTKPEPTTVEAKPEPEPTTVVEETAAAPITGDIDLTDYKSACLDHHNLHRANHSAPAMEWDENLASYAAISAKGCVFEHDTATGGGGYGQNLASWGASGDISGMEVKAAAMGITNQWYNDEMNNWSSYGQSNPPGGLSLNAFGHFTQVVWKGSTKLGCATVKCPSGSVLGVPSWYTICNYSPPGNFGGRYGENVLPPLGEKMVSV